MKFIPLLLVLFVGFSYSATLLDHHDLTTHPPEHISQFFTSLYAHFGLPAPENMLKDCFNPITAEVFFKIIWNTNEILLDMNARESWKFHLNFLRQMITSFWEHPATFCIIKSDEFTELLTALGIQKKDQKLWSLANWLYFQAHFADLENDFAPIIESLEQGNYTGAGDAYAVMLKNFVDRTKSEGITRLALTGFWNGFAMGLEIANPKDSLTIWNGTTAQIMLEFLDKVALSVGNGKWDDAWGSLENYWNQKGKELIGKIPENVWEELKKSKDYASVTSNLGMELAGDDFRHLLLKFIGKRSLRFFMEMRGLEKNLNDFHMLHSGAMVAAIAKQVVRSQRP